MKKIYLMLSVFIGGTVYAYADEIYLKDNSVIKGKIIKVTPYNLEYDPEGYLPFCAIERNKIKKIIYSNGKEVVLPETTQCAYTTHQSIFERAFSSATINETKRNPTALHDETLKERGGMRNNNSSVESFHHMLTLRMFYMFSDVSLAIKHCDQNGEKTEQTEEIDYYPNNGFYWGISAFCRGLGIRFAINTGCDDEDECGKTTSRNIQLFYYTPTIGIEFFYQNFKGYYLHNPEDFDLEAGDAATIQPDLKVCNVGLNVVYSFNDQFSLEAALTQTERQMDWEVAFLIMLSANYITIDNNESLIPASEQEKYGDDASYKGGIYKSLSLAPGFGITIPFRNFYVTSCLFLGSGIMNKKDFINSKDLASNQSFFKFNFKFGAGYNGDRFFTGFFFQGDSTDSQSWDDKAGVIVSANVFYLEVFGGTRI